MHSIKLNIQDSVFDKVIYFLQSLPKNEVKIIDGLDEKDTVAMKKFNSIELNTKNFKFNREEASER